MGRAGIIIEIADKLRQKELNEYREHQSRYSNPPYSMDLCNHEYSDYIRSLSDSTSAKSFEADDWKFQCPKCGSHHFGSYMDEEPLIRHCNDQFGKGCRWEGLDADCKRPVEEVKT